MDQRWGLTAGGWPTRGLLYRDAVKAAAAIEWAISGQTTCHYQPGHPHGFHEHIYLGEVYHCHALYDPEGLCRSSNLRS